MEIINDLEIDIIEYAMSVNTNKQIEEKAKNLVTDNYDSLLEVENDFMAICGENYEDYKVALENYLFAMAWIYVEDYKEEVS
jgi:hypothetical protein